MLSGEDNPTCSLSSLAEHSQDLLALSDDQGDPSGERLGKLADIFPRRLYAALQIMDIREDVHAYQTARLAAE